MGSLRFQTDSSQSVTGSGLFEAFGAPVGATGTTMPFGFVGGADCQTEADTGLVLMGHRYYDSRIGRFLTPDPAKAGTNWYNYCNNDPVNNLDPLGLVCAAFDSTGMSFSQIYDHILANGGLPGESYETKEGKNVIFSFMISSSDFTHVIPGFNVSQNFMQARRYANTPIFKQLGFGLGGQSQLSFAPPSVDQKIAYLIATVYTGSHGDPKHLLKGPTGNTMYKYYDRIGQYNFGAVAAGLGLDLTFSQVGAGVAQTGISMFKGTFSENLVQNGWAGSGSPYGDDPASQYWIMRGYNDYKNR